MFSSSTSNKNSPRQTVKGRGRGCYGLVSIARGLLSVLFFGCFSVSLLFNETQRQQPRLPSAHYVAEDDLNLSQLLPLLSDCWEYRHTPCLTLQQLGDQTQGLEHNKQVLGSQLFRSTLRNWSSDKKK